MAVKNRAQIGWINCPMCETEASVHKCAVGRGSRAEAKYWRCECGTIQPWKPGGQRFIAENFRPMQPAANEPEKPSAPPPSAEPEPVAKPQAETADEYTPGEQTPPPENRPKPQKRGLLHTLFVE